MKKIVFDNLEQCEGAIKAFEMTGQDVPSDWLEQRDSFLLKKQAKQIDSSSDTPIYNKLVAEYPYGTMPQVKKDCIENTVTKLLEDGPHAAEPGLLLGKIQCGKTDTFEDIIGLAFDKGIDVCVVFTKGTKALATQTESRMKRDYRFFKQTDDSDPRTTINIYDIMKVWKNLKQAKVESGKTVIVCKKQAQNLKNLIALFTEKSPFLKKKKVLVVDDEADFASRNYRSIRLKALKDADGNPLPQTREMEMAKISQQIDDFRQIPEYCRYLQVTATPYCLYLQPQGELNLNGNKVMPFKPRFTELVPTHSAYVGGDEYYVKSQNPDSMYSYLYHQIDQTCIDVMGHEDKRYLNNSTASKNLYGLMMALMSYFMATAIRRIQERKKGKRMDYKTSALIHVEIDKKNHDWQLRVVNRLIDDIKKVVVEEDAADQRVWNAIDVAYDDFVKSNEKGRSPEEHLIDVEMPSKEDVLTEMKYIFDPKIKRYHVQVVNSDEQVESMLDEETGELSLDTPANIFIGGNILDRGITIKNMLCFFYGRNPKNFQQDTVLQHARMYGARSMEDMAVTRLHTTDVLYKILVRMHTLDSQLRQWFIDGNDGNDVNAVFVGYDKNIKPCSPQKIKASNTLTLSAQTRIVPSGFWTGTKTAISKTIQKIDNIISSCPCFNSQDSDGIFEIDKETVVEILKLIESTYIYDEKFFNTNRKNDIKEMLCALEYCAGKSNGKMFAFQRTNRNMSRVRANGSWVDAPDDGRTDLEPARRKAIDAPLIMLIRQNGERQVDPNTGDNIGWNNTPFYWPVLVTQQNIEPVMYALDQSLKQQVAVVDNSDILEGINPEEVLKLTYSGDMFGHFGEEGADYSELPVEDWPIETRALKDTTASKYLLKDENGEWLKNANVPFDAEHDHGLYSLNNEQFPFVFRPYKYMLLANGRDAKADLMLLRLSDVSKWYAYVCNTLDEEGDLYDCETDNILMHGSDTLVGRDLSEKDYRDDTIVQWRLAYPVQKVERVKRNTTDWNQIFQDEENADA